MVITATKVKAGRSYKVGINGAEDVSVKYQLVLAAPLGESELPLSFSGVPQIGTAHPTRSGFKVIGYDVSQPAGAAKSTLDVVVRYAPTDLTITPPGETTPEKVEEVTEWGWDDGTGEKDLVADALTGKPVVNSAGDPFDTAPTHTVPMPTFTKVIRSSEQKSIMAFLCKTNDTALAIGGVTCAPDTLLCTISMRKIIGEWRMPYEYTVHLRYRSNIVPDAETGMPVEVGWNAAVVDAGMRAIDSETGKLTLIQVISQETGEPATVTSPELLDGHGAAQSRGSGGSAQPIVLTFHAYQQVTFEEWMYSEPPTPTPPS